MVNTIQASTSPKKILSISELKEMHLQEELRKEQLLKNQPKKSFTIDEFTIVWKKFAYQCKEEGMDTLYNVLASRDPKIDLQQFMVDVQVSNNIELSFVNSNMDRLLNFLRTNLENFSIVIKIIEDKLDEKKILFSGKEKFDDMANRNPMLKALQKKFKLDIEF